MIQIWSESYLNFKTKKIHVNIKCVWCLYQIFSNLNVSSKLSGSIDMITQNQAKRGFLLEEIFCFKKKVKR